MGNDSDRNFVEHLTWDEVTPSDKTSPNYSRSGSYGDPTLATAGKGEILLAAILDDLDEQVAGFMAETSAAKPRSNPIRSVSR
jgi:creatinine amidohydrolase